MMDFCIARALEESFNVLWLGVWKLNPGAIRFYEKFGFANFGMQIFKIADEEQWDQLMRLDLT